MKERMEKLQEVFNQALEYTDAIEQGLFLRRTCGEDRALLQQVEELLEAHQCSEGFLHADPRTLSATLTCDEAASFQEASGTMIGRYKLLEKIGEGGMGVVYMAEQTEPVIRKVALKIIKLGMDTRSVVARFEAERQALAMMDHPNIAKVLDGGATELMERRPPARPVLDGTNNQAGAETAAPLPAGRPYFVMELVRGEPITKFCQSQKLNLRERLDLFRQVCEAVQHAHQKGIIHRDIKPSNVLVSLDYGKPTPKVIDFGIAKATNQKLTEKTLFTRFAQMIGTPAYMSPEQAEMSSLDVDTRTDVYSLGILLYELLTDSTPFSEKRLRSVGYDEMRRIIREEEPEKPSTRLTKQRTHSANAKPSTLDIQRSAVPSDLDWIVMKALDKDRRRRYDTPNEFADDIERHLKNEPVVARPPRVMYRLQKFVQRNRATTTAAAAIALSLLLGTVVSIHQAIRATQAERSALAERDAADLARQAAEEAQARADASAASAARNLTRAEAVNQWVMEDLLLLGDAWRATSDEAIAGKNVTLREAILAACANLENRFQNAPEIEGALRLAAGKTLHAVGEMEASLDNLQRAYPLLKESLGPTHFDTLEAESMLGWRLAWDHWGRRRNSGEDRRLADQGRQLMEEAYRTSQEAAGEGALPPLRLGLRLAFHYANARDLELAESLVPGIASQITNRVRLGQLVAPDDVFGAESCLAWLRFQQGRLAEARQLYGAQAGREEAYQRLHGYYHARAADVFWAYGGLLMFWDKDYERAGSVLTRALTISTERFGVGYPTENILGALTQLHFRQQHYDQASDYLRQMVQANLEGYGPNDAQTAGTVGGLAGMYAAQGNWAAAMREYTLYREKGIVNPDNLATELLLRHLGGDRSGEADLRRRLWEELDKAPGEGISREAVRILLVLPTEEADWQRVLEAAEAQSAHAPTELVRSQFQTLASFKQGDWGETVKGSKDALQAKGQWSRVPAVQTGYLVAMAEHHLGNRESAARALDESNRFLDALLRPGWIPGSFHQIALCLVTRDQAEELIHGRRISPPVTMEWMADRREQWKPIETLLDQADDAARRLDYVSAAGFYQTLLRTHELDFNAFLEPLLVSPVIKAATAFLQSGDTPAYLEFCRRTYQGAVGEEWDLGIVCLTVFPGDLPEDLHRKLATWNNIRTAEAIRESTMLEEPYHNYLLQIGMVCYRFGRYEDGIVALRVAMKAPNHAEAMLATAFAAMTAQRLDDREAARRYLEKAGEGWQVMTDFPDVRLNPNWSKQAIFQLALKEARQLIEPSRTPVSVKLPDRQSTDIAHQPRPETAKPKPRTP